MAPSKACSYADVTDLISQHTATLTAVFQEELEKCKERMLSESAKLTAEVINLREELAAVKAALTPHNQHSPTAAAAVPSEHSTSPSPPSFADIVKSSVQSVLQEEKVKSDIIVANFKDSKQDVADVDALCTEVGFSSKPIDIQRLGKMQTDRPRLMKISFQTAFDARAFQTKVEEAKKSDSLTQSTIKCRPGRTKEEQAKHTKLSKTVYELNTSAKQKDSPVESFSLRQNGQIWKFQLSENGKWIRATDWQYQPPAPASGNGNPSPKSSL